VSGLFPDSTADLFDGFPAERLIAVVLPEPEHAHEGKTYLPGCVVVHGTAMVQIAGQTMTDPREIRRKAASMLVAADMIEDS
jgi:hypothetical protein